MKLRLDRRRFLSGTFGSLGAVIAARVGWLFPEGRQVFSRMANAGLDDAIIQAPVEGEPYAGFLLLPEIEAPMPPSVRLVEGINLHSEDPSPEDPTLRGETIKLSSVGQLRSRLPFSLYIPTQLPSDLQLVEASITRYVPSGGIWDAVVTYGKQNEYGTLEKRISLTAQPLFAQPYPVWPVRDFRFIPTPKGPQERMIFPEKVTFPPLSSGVLRPSAQGHVLLWIEQDILYTLVAEHDPTRESVKAVVASLIRT